MRRLMPFMVLATGALLFWAAPRAWAQAPGLEDGPPPPPPDYSTPAPDSSSSKPDYSKAAPDVDPTQPPEPAWDPLRASKNIEVGSYYLKVGNYKAAIGRFKEAAQAQPGLAKPYLLLGKAYEKTDDTGDALRAYKKYLDLYPKAPDTQEVQKTIAKLTSKTERKTGQQASR